MELFFHNFFSYILIIFFFVMLILAVVKIQTWVKEFHPFSKPRFYLKSYMEIKYCPKCQQELPIDNFYHYKNPKRNGIILSGHTWIHTICLVCQNELNKARSKRKPKKLSLPTTKQIIEARNNTKKNKRICKVCNTELELNEKNFYYLKKFDRYEYQCIDCRRIISIGKRNIRDEIQAFENPGEYPSNHEKKEVFQLLKRIGWQYSESKQIWYKPGLKNKNNGWIFEKRIR